MCVGKFNARHLHPALNNAKSSLMLTAVCQGKFIHWIAVVTRKASNSSQAGRLRYEHPLSLA